MHLVKFFIYYFKIFGIFPLTMIKKTKTNQHQQLCTSSKQAIIYNVLLTITVTLIIVIRTPLFYFSNNYVRVKFEIGIDLVQDISLTITCVTTLLMYNIKHEKLVTIVNKFNHVLDYSASISIEITDDEKKISKRLIIMIFIDIIVMLIIVSTLIPQDLTYTLYCASLYICVMVIRSMFVQYTVALSIIKLFFEKLNHNLWLFSKQSYCSSENQLLQLRKLYSFLNDLSQEISKFYSYPMLFASINMFFSLIFPAYYIFKPIVLGENDLSLTSFIHVFSYWYFCFHSLGFLSVAVSATVNEVIIYNLSEN